MVLADHLVEVGHLVCHLAVPGGVRRIGAVDRVDGGAFVVRTGRVEIVFRQRSADLIETVLFGIEAAVALAADVVRMKLALYQQCI